MYYVLFNLQQTFLSLYAVFRKKHPFTFSFIALWKMFTFSQNFHGMFGKKQVLHFWKR